MHNNKSNSLPSETARLPPISNLMLSYPGSSRKNSEQFLPVASDPLSDFNMQHAQSNWIPRLRNTISYGVPPTVNHINRSFGFDESSSNAGPGAVVSAQYTDPHYKFSHKKSYSLSGMPSESSAPFSLEEEETILSSLSKAFNSNFSRDMEVLREKYLELVDKSPTQVPSNIPLLRGFINVAGVVRYIIESNMREFVLSIPKSTLQNLKEECDEYLLAIRHLIKLQDKYANQKSTMNFAAANHRHFPEGYSFAHKPRTMSMNTPTKRRKTSSSSSSFSAPSSNLRSFSLSSAKSLMPINVKSSIQPSNSMEFSHQPKLGGLNAELSKKVDVTCSHCGSKNTPEWRKGKDGSKTLCNACGLFYSKLAKKYGADEAVNVMSERKERGLVTNRRMK